MNSGHHTFNHDLRRDSLARLVMGGGVATSLMLAFPPTMPAGWPAGMASVVLALLAGTLLRGLELRAFFGRQLSLHQSQSLQLVVDIARWASPLQSRRRLETELVTRETGLPPELVGAWSGARQRWRVALLPALVAVSLTCFTDDLPLILSAWLATAAAVIAATWPTLRSMAARQPGARRQLRSELAMLAVSVTALAVEAQLLTPLALAMPGTTAAWLYVAFGLVRAIPVTPFGLGPFQLLLAPLLVGMTIAPAQVSFWSLVLHLVWVVMSAAAAAAYLTRYKLQARDFFDRRLAAQLARTRRPAGGWHLPAGSNTPGMPLSVVIPAYNERLRLPLYLPLVVEFLERELPGAEVIVVDDGSSDGTAEYVAEQGERHPCVRLLHRPRNGGKGRAVLDGVEAARGAYILVADADGATPIEEARKLMDAARAGAEIAIGSRVAGQLPRGRDALRAALGRSFYRLVNFLAVPGISDTQCGFKLFRADVGRALFRELGEHGWAFDVEILYRAQLVGYAVAEVPVRWQEIAGSKVRPFRDGYRMILSLQRIRSTNSGFFALRTETLLASRIGAARGG